jgi:hypothetical protein
MPFCYAFVQNDTNELAFTCYDLVQMTEAESARRAERGNQDAG